MRTIESMVRDDLSRYLIHGLTLDNAVKKLKSVRHGH
jgi:hypothetical protein